MRKCFRKMHLKLGGGWGHCGQSSSSESMVMCQPWRCEGLKKAGSKKREMEAGVNNTVQKEGMGFGDWRVIHQDGEGRAKDHFNFASLSK